MDLPLGSLNVACSTWENRAMVTGMALIPSKHQAILRPHVLLMMPKNLKNSK